MCKLLVFTKVMALPNDAGLLANTYLPGHVIDILEDDQDFTADDVGDHATVIELTGTPKAEVDYLLTPVLKEVKSTIMALDKLTGFLVPTETKGNQVEGLRMWKARNITSLKAAPKLSLVKGTEFAFVDTNFVMADVAVTTEGLLP